MDRRNNGELWNAQIAGDNPEWPKEEALCD